MKTRLRFLPALLLASVACSTPTDLATASNAKLAAASISEQAAQPTATCTYTDNGNGTWAGLVVWSKVSVRAIRFHDGNGTIQEGPLNHTYRSASAGFSNMPRIPQNVDLLGRSGETLLTVACTAA